MAALEKAWDKFRTVINIMCAVFCLIVVAALVIQIFCRNFLGFSTTWSEEVAEMCFTGLIFCYLSQAEKEGAHLQLEVLFQIFPKLEFYLQVIGRIFCIIYCGFVLYSEKLLIPTITKLTTSACHIPVRFIHYLIILGSFMWLVQDLFSIRDLIRKRKEHKI